MRTIDRRWIAIATFVCGILLLNFAGAKIHFAEAVDRRSSRLPSETQDKLPSADLLRGIFLGFGTMAADIAWIWSIVYYGKHLDGSARPSYLEHSAETVSELDPKFYKVYPWFSATYIKATYPPRFEDLQTVNDFLERGMKHYPTNYRLPYEAGLNYIGYSKDRSKSKRVRELSQGIQYLQRASRLQGAPDHLPMTVSWMYQRRRQLRAPDSDSDMSRHRIVSRKQVEFLAEMYYLMDDAGTRRSLERMLVQSDYGKKLLTQYKRRYERRLRRRRSETFPYLALALWSQVISTTQ